MALLHVTYRSQILHMNVDMDVILPEQAKGQIGMENVAGATYPTLYLLHGMSDDHTTWQRRTSIERYAAGKNLAVVMPSTDHGWYTDGPFGTDYWQFISEELPAICRNMFPHMSRRREDTFVAGLSMGGYGALKCGLRASDVFSYAAGLSSAADIVDVVYNVDVSRNRDYWENNFGPAAGIEGSFNDLFAAAEDLKKEDPHKVKFYMWCGTEDFLYHQNVKLRDHLSALGFDLVYEEAPGNHSWHHWDEKIRTVLDWLPLGKEGI